MRTTGLTCDHGRLDSMRLVLLDALVCGPNVATVMTNASTVLGNPG